MLSIKSCLGQLIVNQSSVVVVTGGPSPIVVPTSAPTTPSTTTVPATTTMPPTSTVPPPPVTTVSTSPPTTAQSLPPVTSSTVPPAVTTVQPGVAGTAIPLIICADPEMVCTLSPRTPTVGSLQIISRLGTIPPSSAAINQHPVAGYSAQIPSYDTSVKFPRSRRSTNRIQKQTSPCLGLLPGNPSPIVISPGIPAPIIIPTSPPNTTTPTVRPTVPGNVTVPPVTTAPTMPPVTTPPTTAPTLPPTTAPTLPPTTAPTLPPTTAPTLPPTTAPTLPPTTAPTLPPMTTPPTVPTQATTMPTMTVPTPTTTTTTTTTLAPPPATTIQPTIGPLPIDPRLGTTPAPSAALNLPPIVGYSAQVPSNDAAVKFPRSRRSVASKFIDVKDFVINVQRTEVKHNIVKRQSCSCVPTGTCNRNSGAGMIDIRIVTPVQQCPTGQEYCCNTGGGGVVNPINCGVTQNVPATAVAPAAGQANFGEFPWQALILTKQNDYIAGGVLIDGLNVLTVTHRLLPYVVSGTAPNVKVRLGEWDAAGTYEPVPYQEYSVSKVFSNPSYNANTLQFDIMVLRLASAVPFTPGAGAAVTINRACLPPSSGSVYTGQRCMVSGWGKDMFGQQGLYQQILKKVDVPIVAPATCQSQLQAARLGASFALDTTSFVCAGGEANKDACTGDGGSGLVCQVNGQWVVVGLVAWGLGCANTNVPGVYVNVAALLPWIQQQVATP